MAREWTSIRSGRESTRPSFNEARARTPGTAITEAQTAQMWAVLQ